MIQRHVIGGGTEAPFTGRTVNGYKYNSKRRGTYDCAVCGIPAYSSTHKFESGTGWPSFYKVKYIYISNMIQYFQFQTPYEYK